MEYLALACAYPRLHAFSACWGNIKTSGRRWGNIKTADASQPFTRVGSWDGTFADACSGSGSDSDSSLSLPLETSRSGSHLMINVCIVSTVCLFCGRSHNDEHSLLQESKREIFEEKVGDQMDKKVIIVGTDDSEQSVYALQWTLEHLFVPFASSLGQLPFKLLLLHARPTATSVLRVAGPVVSGAAEVLPLVESDLRKIGTRALENAKALCQSHNVMDVEMEMIEGDARNVLCDAVERHGASILVVGSHGYGAIKRVFLGSVSDYCAHNAKCTVMIVKKPKGVHPASSSSSSRC